jgi:hypothetical protein
MTTKPARRTLVPRSRCSPHLMRGVRRTIAMTETVFKPRLLSHSVLDALLSLCIDLFQALLLFVLPSLQCYWVFGSTSLALLTALGDSVAHGGYDYFSSFAMRTQSWC